MELLLFNFVPKMIIISASIYYYNKNRFPLLIALNGIDKTMSLLSYDDSYASIKDVIIQFNSNKVLWYIDKNLSEGYMYQLNASSKTYYYVALG